MAVPRTTSIVSEEELQLRKRARRRLVGAVALVAIAVVVLPLVLDHEPSEPLRNVQVEMAPQAATQPAVAPASDEAAQPAPAAEQAPPPPAATPAPAGTPPAAAQQPSPQPSAASEPAPALPEPKPFAVAPKPAQPAEFVIQLGAFGELSRARTYEQRLKKAGFPVYLERVNGTNKTRVRAGPYGSREAAERAYQQMKQRRLTDPSTAGQIVPRGQ